MNVDQVVATVKPLIALLLGLYSLYTGYLQPNKPIINALDAARQERNKALLRVIGPVLLAGSVFMLFRAME